MQDPNVPTPPGAGQPTPPGQPWPQSPGAPHPIQFTCPHCHAHTAPYQQRRISTGGWITFAVLMFLCLPLFWIGLLIKEDQTFCSTCGVRLG